MIIQDLKIKDFEHIKHIAPNTSSGTGYCEYETIKVIYENDLTQIVTIPNWYTSTSEQVKQLKENIKNEMLQKGYYIIMDQETIDKFLKIMN